MLNINLQLVEIRNLGIKEGGFFLGYYFEKPTIPQAVTNEPRNECSLICYEVIRVFLKSTCFGSAKRPIVYAIDYAHIACNISEGRVLEKREEKQILKSFGKVISTKPYLNSPPSCHYQKLPSLDVCIDTRGKCHVYARLFVGRLSFYKF